MSQCSVKYSLKEQKYCIRSGNIINGEADEFGFIEVGFGFSDPIAHSDAPNQKHNISWKKMKRRLIFYQETCQYILSDWLLYTTRLNSKDI